MSRKAALSRSQKSGSRPQPALQPLQAPFTGQTIDHDQCQYWVQQAGTQGRPAACNNKIRRRTCRRRPGPGTLSCPGSAGWLRPTVFYIIMFDALLDHRAVALAELLGPVEAAREPLHQSQQQPADEIQSSSPAAPSRSTRSPRCRRSRDKCPGRGRRSRPCGSCCSTRGGTFCALGQPLGVRYLAMEQEGCASGQLAHAQALLFGSGPKQALVLGRAACSPQRLSKQIDSGARAPPLYHGPAEHSRMPECSYRYGCCPGFRRREPTAPLCIAFRSTIFKPRVAISSRKLERNTRGAACAVAGAPLTGTRR